jgi:phosphatidate cytidylyltransferase
METHRVVPALWVYPWGAELWRRMGSLIFVIGPVWLGDTAAFLVGSIWGRHKLAPRVSPGKTIEGSAAGLVASIVGAMLAGWWLGMNLVPSALLGVMMGVVGQVGDLGKSVLKRDLGIKDFGIIFGPHGGVLDRFDAILFSLPLVYWYFWFLVMKVGGM